MLLAVITGIEIITVYLPFAAWLLVTALVVISAVKFLFVIFYLHASAVGQAASARSCSSSA